MGGWHLYLSPLQGGSEEKEPVTKMTDKALNLSPLFHCALMT